MPINLLCSHHLHKVSAGSRRCKIRTNFSFLLRGVGGPHHGQRPLIPSVHGMSLLWQRNLQRVRLSLSKLKIPEKPFWSLLQPGQRHGTNHSGCILQTLKRKLRCEEGNQQNAVWQLFAGPGTVSPATVPSAQCPVSGGQGCKWQCLGQGSPSAMVPVPVWLESLKSPWGAHCLSVHFLS